MRDLKTILSKNKIVPVVVLQRLSDTIPLCEAILEGGLDTVEITLRTDVAMPCMEEAAKRFPQMAIGAGTILNADQIMQAKNSGAAYGVSPGMTDVLRDAVLESDLPFLPGGSTVSEFMTNAEAGFSIQKFFPAEQSGGVGFLKSIASPLPHLSFCPTGGINQEDMVSYLSLPNVIAIGGSWFISPDRVENQEWSAIADDVRGIVCDHW